MVSILTEPSFNKSVWCRSLYAGLTEQLRLRRIPFCEIFDTLVKDSETIFIIAANYHWIESTVKMLNAHEITPIVICNQLEAIPGCNYSCVCSDVYGSMRYLLNSLKAEGKSRVALYGVNTDSIADISRVDSLFAVKDAFFEPMDIFQNNGSLQTCFASFLPVCQNFDAVICTNDFAAISLERHLHQQAPQVLKTLKILSCAQTHLLQYCGNAITTIDLDYEQYGKAAVLIYEMLRKHPYMSDMRIAVRWRAAQRLKRPLTTDTAFSVPTLEDNFYHDGELQEMLKIETLLAGCDDADRTILHAVLQQLSLEKICETCFFTENAVRYRIKKLLTAAGVENKQALITLLRKYALDI